MLTGLDYAILAIMVLSALRGLWRGLVAEIFSLIGWVAAIITAWHYVNVLAPHMPANWPGGQSTQWLLAFVILVIGVMIIAGIVGALLNRLTDATGLRSVDRSLGMLFGLVRGGVLILLLVMLAKFTDLPKQSFWRDALLRPYAEQGLSKLQSFFPDFLPDRLPVKASHRRWVKESEFQEPVQSLEDERF